MFDETKLKVYILKGNEPHRTTKELLDKMKFSLSNKKVFIKANLHPNKYASTDINVVRAILEKLRNCDVTIGGNADKYFEINNYYDLEKEFGVKLLNLEKDDVVIKKVRNPARFNEFPVAKSFVDADYVINVAKLKIHSHARVTLCLKNLFGCIPGRRIRLTIHPFINDAIYDYMQIFKPDLNIIDGIVGNQNECLPNPIRSNIVIGGYDPLVVDVVGAKCMGVNPEEVEYLKLLKYEDKEIEIIGEKIENVVRHYNKRKPLKAYMRYFIENCSRVAIKLKLLDTHSKVECDENA